MNLFWARRLIIRLAAPAVAAVIGATVGGWITADVVSRDTRAQLVASSYVTYLTEANRALSIACGSTFSDDEKDRFRRATAVLRLTASDRVYRRAKMFKKSVFEGDDDKGYVGKYEALHSAMSNELMGRGEAASDSDGEC